MKLPLILVLSLSLLPACQPAPGQTSSGTANSISQSPSARPSGLPAAYLKFGTNVAISLDGETIVLKTNGTPDHNSPYYGTGSAKYEAPPATMRVNPNQITNLNATYRLPLKPQAAASVAATPMGPIGIALNGVALFNNQAAPGDSLQQEMATFDSHNGHPTPNGIYHYHIEPTSLTKDDAALVGFLLDGFPVYGKRDQDGSVPTDLDAAHGHTKATADYPQGVYHYHVSDADPYIAGGFRGTPGTVTTR